MNLNVIHDIGTISLKQLSFFPPRSLYAEPTVRPEGMIPAPSCS